MNPKCKYSLQAKKQWEQKMLHMLLLMRCQVEWRQLEQNQTPDILLLMRCQVKWRQRLQFPVVLMGRR